MVYFIANYLLNIIVVLKLVPTTYASSYDCSAGYWGSACRDECGHCEGGNVFCFVINGHCFNGCAAGYTGELCRMECKPGVYGQNCLKKCGHCSQINPVCDKKTGKCPSGCEPGYESPYCHRECPFNTWGRDCVNECDCPDNCGCDHKSGQCEPCDANGKPTKYVIPENHQCINQYLLDKAVKKYEPPSVLSIPYLPVLYCFGLIFLFVLANFLWWLVTTQKAAPADDDIDDEPAAGGDNKAMTKQPPNKEKETPAQPPASDKKIKPKAAKPGPKKTASKSSSVDTAA